MSNQNYQARRRHRDQTVIAAKILEMLAEKPSSKSDMVYGIRLSYKQVEELLEPMLSKGLIKAEGSEYVLVDKGLEALNHLKAYHAIVGERL